MKTSEERNDKKLHAATLDLIKVFQFIHSFGFIHSSYVIVSRMLGICLRKLCIWIQKASILKVLKF
jgi:hypothetical protein